MNKRDVMMSFLKSNQSQPYVPAAFFLHFPSQFHAGQAAVDKHIEFFRQTGMDFVKIQYERTFPTLAAIQSPADWSKMPRYELDFFAGQLEVVKGLVQALKGEAAVIQTLYSPFMLAGQTVGAARLAEHLDRDPQAVRKGLEAVTDSLLGFAVKCAQLGVDGFYHSTQGGEAGRFADPRTFTEHVKPYDLIVMNKVKHLCPLNILHVCDYHRDYDDFAPFLDYPGVIVNSPLKVGDRTLTPKEASALFGGRPWMGGLERKGVLLNGTPDGIRGAVAALIAEAPPRFVLGADCTVLDHTPWENLKIAIEAAHAAAR